MVPSFLKTIGDITSLKIIFFVSKVGMISFVLSLVLMWSFWDMISILISNYLDFIPWQWLQTSSQTLLKLLFGYILFIAFVTFFTSWWSEDILREIALRHYPNHQPSTKPQLQEVIRINLKASLLFIVLFVIALPLIFIPIIGQAVMLYLWSIQIKKPTSYDIGSLFNAPKATASTPLALIAASFNYIPILSIFAPLFAQILFLHEFARKNFS